MCQNKPTKKINFFYDSLNYEIWNIANTLYLKVF